jgi:hypothetical protein
MSARRSGRSRFARSTRGLRADPVIAPRRAKPHDTHPIIFEEALHTYFAISDISRIAISGLAGSTYIDKSDAARRKPQTAALVAITAETDRVYLDTPGRCAIETRRDRQPMTLSVRRRQTADNRDYRWSSTPDADRCAVFGIRLGQRPSEPRDLADRLRPAAILQLPDTRRA